MAKEEQTNQYIRIAEIAGAVILLAALLWYISRLLKNLRLASAEAWTPVMQPVSEAMFGAPGAAAMPSLPGMAPPIMQQSSSRPVEKLPEPEPEFTLPKAQTPNAQDEQMNRVLTRMAEENPASVAEIIQLWLNEDEGKRG